MSDRKKSRSCVLAKEVASLINNGLLQAPDLISELPPFLVALESGKAVELGKISSDSGREVVEKLYELIPKLASEYDMDLKNIRKLLIKCLLDAKCIVQPKCLSASESLSVKSAPVLLLDLLTRFPSLKAELGGLFCSVLEQEKDSDGGANCIIDISGIGDEDIEEGVGKVLAGLGLVEVGFDDRRYEFPPAGSSKRSNCVGALKHFRNMFPAPVGAPDREPRDSESNPRGSKRHKSSHGRGASSEHSSGSGSDSGSECSEPGGSAPLHTGKSSIGPAMPSAAQLRSAQEAAVVAESDSDDDYGPRLVGEAAGSAPSRARTGVGAALGGADYDSESDEALHGAPVPTGGTTVSGEGGDGPAAREEWMMVPGEHDLFGSAVNRGKHLLSCISLPSASVVFNCVLRAIVGDAASVLVNKGFQTGKLAKKAAEAVEAFKEESQAEYERENSAEHAAAQALMEEYRLARGPSLMETHLENVKAGKKPKSRGLERSERKSFSREEDVLPRAKLTARDANEMVNDAKQLDSRFSKGTVQKSF